MKSCLLCPKGKQCRGYVLHLLILTLYEAMERGGDVISIVNALSREDMAVMAEQGAKARETCWSKGFVMVVARKVADIVRSTPGDQEMRTAIERMIVRMDHLFTKLPKGIGIDLADLAIEVYNRATEILDQEGSDAVIPASLVGQACFAVSRRKKSA